MTSDATPVHDAAAPAPVRSPAPSLALAVAALLAVCLGFGWWQNHHGTIGGAISLAKMLWLFTALAYFFLVPAWLRRDPALSPPARRLFHLYFAGYVLRALIELPMLVWTHAWRVEHGILHNVAMFALVMHLRRALPPAQARDVPARLFLPLLLTAAFAETLNAWLFGRAGSPQTGQYFASGDPVFIWINRITWVEVAVLVPALAWWLVRYHASRRPA